MNPPSSPKPYLHVDESTPKRARVEGGASDLALVQRMQQGDERALGELYDKWMPVVASLIHRMLKGGASPDDVEDVVEETFWQVWRQSARFTAERESVQTWILTIARRLCTDRARWRARRPTVALDVVALGDATPGADAQLERARQTRALRQAIAELPEDQRAVVALQVWDGLEYEEIAAIERVPVGTVRSRLARAKEALKRALGLDDEERNGTDR